MPPVPIRERSPKGQSPLRTSCTPPLSITTDSSSSSAKAVEVVSLRVLNVAKSDDGDKVTVGFSDHKFTFPTSWLYECRKDEGLPHHGEHLVKNPSNICVHSVKLFDGGTWATVNITWNTGTTSRFPILWLRVWGPLKIVKTLKTSPREPSPPRLPALSGKNPRSGVGQLTRNEKNLRDRYRALLMDAMMDVMEGEWLFEEWLSELPTSLLRETLNYVAIELQIEPMAAQVAAVEESYNDAIADSSREEKAHA